MLAVLSLLRRLFLALFGVFFECVISRLFIQEVMNNDFLRLIGRIVLIVIPERRPSLVPADVIR
jgi:hypothetical protein